MSEGQTLRKCGDACVFAVEEARKTPQVICSLYGMAIIRKTRLTKPDHFVLIARDSERACGWIAFKNLCSLLLSAHCPDEMVASLKWLILSSPNYYGRL